MPIRGWLPKTFAKCSARGWKSLRDEVPVELDDTVGFDSCNSSRWCLKALWAVALFCLARFPRSRCSSISRVISKYRARCLLNPRFRGPSILKKHNAKFTISSLTSMFHKIKKLIRTMHHAREPRDGGRVAELVNKIAERGSTRLMDRSWVF